MYKLREHGGAKLVNVQAKSEASKIQWLAHIGMPPILSYRSARGAEREATRVGIVLH